jgi:hypothetical protein
VEFGTNGWTARHLPIGGLAVCGLADGGGASRVRAGRWTGPRQRAWRHQGPIYLAAAERRTDGRVREDSRGPDSRVNGRVARADADQTVDTTTSPDRTVSGFAGDVDPLPVRGISPVS